jgi:hypothetical protein
LDIHISQLFSFKDFSTDSKHVNWRNSFRPNAINYHIPWN